MISESGKSKAICTLPQFKKQNIPRNCTNSRQWRCDSGWCIDGDKRMNGIADCPNDISDESFSKFGDLIIQRRHFHLRRKGRLSGKVLKFDFLFQLTSSTGT